jgi:hypothetical protein
MEEGRRQAYLAALGIPVWSARADLPGAMADIGIEYVPFTDDALEPEESSAAFAPEPPPAPHEVREAVPPQVAQLRVTSTVPASAPQPSVAPPVSAPAATVAAARTPAPQAPATAGPGVEFPVFQFWFKALPQGWQLLIAMGDLPDLSGREHALLAQIEQVLGGEGQQAPLAFRWPLNNNPAIPRDAQAARESVGAFLGRQRRAGERVLLLGQDLQPYVQAALGDSLVVADRLDQLLAEPLRKRALWQALAGQLA